MHLFACFCHTLLNLNFTRREFWMAIGFHGMIMIPRFVTSSTPQATWNENGRPTRMCKRTTLAWLPEMIKFNPACNSTVSLSYSYSWWASTNHRWQSRSRNRCGCSPRARLSLRLWKLKTVWLGAEQDFGLCLNFCKCDQQSIPDDDRSQSHILTRRNFYNEGV